MINHHDTPFDWWQSLHMNIDVLWIALYIAIWPPKCTQWIYTLFLFYDICSGIVKGLATWLSSFGRGILKLLNKMVIPFFLYEKSSVQTYHHKVDPYPWKIYPQHYMFWPDWKSRHSNQPSRDVWSGKQESLYGFSYSHQLTVFDVRFLFLISNGLN